MKLSPVGHVANSCWIEIANHFSFVVLHNHVIMPNHMHGIIEIAKSNDARIHAESDISIKTSKSNESSPVETPKLDTPVETPKLGVSTKDISTNQKRTANANKKWTSNTLGTIINQYKRACTINARQINTDFAWQTNYHDHIIRNKKSFQNISAYIMDNPLKWNEDTFHPNNHKTKK